MPKISLLNLASTTFSSFQSSTYHYQFHLPKTLISATKGAQGPFGLVSGCDILHPYMTTLYDFILLHDYILHTLYDYIHTTIWYPYMTTYAVAPSRMFHSLLRVIHGSYPAQILPSPSDGELSLRNYHWLASPQSYLQVTVHHSCLCFCYVHRGSLSTWPVWFHKILKACSVW